MAGLSEVIERNLGEIAYNLDASIGLFNELRKEGICNRDTVEKIKGAGTSLEISTALLNNIQQRSDEEKKKFLEILGRPTVNQAHIKDDLIRLWKEDLQRPDTVDAPNPPSDPPGDSGSEPTGRPPGNNDDPPSYFS